MGRSQILIYLLRAIAMLLAIPCHEAAHAFVSARLGDDTAVRYGRLTLNPIAHFDLWGALCMIVFGFGWAKPVPTNPSKFKNPKTGMALTALAGPCSNLILAYLSVLFYKMIYYMAPDTVVWGFALNFFYVLASVDVALAVFNLLPIPPFDGSRIVTVFLPQRAYFNVMRYERYIFLGMLALLYLGVLSAPLAFLQDKMWTLLSWSTQFVDKIYLATVQSHAWI